MSAKMEVIGNLAEPKHAVSRDGKAILNLSVGHTYRRKNQQTGQWEDVLGKDGKPETLWVRATFWEDEADFIGQQVRKGMRVHLEGEPQLSVREHNGKTYTNLELKRPSIMFPPQRAPQGGQGASSGGYAGQGSPQVGNAPQNDGWATGGQSFDDPNGMPF